jgi:hypothetical protein
VRDEGKVRGRVEGKNGGRKLQRKTGIFEDVWTELRKERIEVEREGE